MSADIPDRMPGRRLEDTLERRPEKVPKDMLDRMPEATSKDMLKKEHQKNKMKPTNPNSHT